MNTDELFDSIVDNNLMEIPSFIIEALVNEQTKFYESPEIFNDVLEIYVKLLLKALADGDVQFADTPLGDLMNTSTAAFIAATLDYLTKGEARNIRQ